MGMPTALGLPGDTPPHVRSPMILLWGQFSLWRGGWETTRPLGSFLTWCWKILFAFAFSWFYQIFFSGLLGHSSSPSADITFFFSWGTQSPSWSMWDPVCWDQTLGPALRARNLGPWTTREAPADVTFLSQHFPSWVLQNSHSGMGWKAPRVKRAPVVSVPKRWILCSSESLLNMGFIL